MTVLWIPGRPDVEVGIMGSILDAVGGVNLSRPTPAGKTGPLQVTTSFEVLIAGQNGKHDPVLRWSWR